MSSKQVYATMPTPFCNVVSLVAYAYLEDFDGGDLQGRRNLSYERQGSSRGMQAEQCPTHVVKNRLGMSVQVSRHKEKW